MWASKNGKARFCVDYRRFNEDTNKLVIYLPRIDNTLDMFTENDYATLDNYTQFEEWILTGGYAHR